MTATRAVTATFATLLLGAGVAACGGGGDTSSPSAGGSAQPVRELRFRLTDQGCVPANARVPAGPVKIAVSNPGSTKTDELELKNADGIIMGERENLAPGLSSDFTLTLRPGTYVLNCTFQNDQRDNGKITVTGSASAAKAGARDELLTTAVSDYRAYVKGETTQLVAATRRFVAALRGGDLARAKALFGPTRAHYEAVEPIAESFGSLDPDIDARVNDVTSRASWMGFHRIEQVLWVQGTTAGTGHYASRLLADVEELDRKVDGLDLQPAQIANGAVSLLDEVSSSKITGEEDRYSHTDLSDFQANFSGAKEAFSVLKPELVKAGEERLVRQIDTRIAAVQQGLDRYKRHTALGFAPYSALTPADRRRFAQQIAALAEPLSLVAGKILG
jgi:iron uptake system component EfeO